MKGIAVLVLRYTHPGHREYRVPMNFKIGGVEIPLGLGLITLVLFFIAIVNLFTKPQATIAGVSFSFGLFLVFTISEKVLHRQRHGEHVEMDQFNLEQEGELTPESLGARPGNVLVPVSNYHALYHLAAVLDRVKVTRRDVVVLHVRLLRRSGSARATSKRTSFSEASNSISSPKRWLWPKSVANPSSWRSCPPTIFGTR